MKKNVLIIALILSSFTLITKTYGQQRYMFGIDFVNDIVDEQLRPNFGINYGHQLSAHDGIEVGIYYRDYINEDRFYIDNKYNEVDILERRLSIPLLYKFSSRVINFYVGPSFEFFVNWKLKYSSNPDLNLTDYSIDPAYSLGLLFKVGKEIKLADKLILEPEFRLNTILQLERTYWGFSVNLKYDL